MGLIFAQLGKSVGLWSRSYNLKLIAIPERLCRGSSNPNLPPSYLRLNLLERFERALHGLKGEGQEPEVRQVTSNLKPSRHTCEGTLVSGIKNSRHSGMLLAGIQRLVKGA